MYYQEGFMRDLTFPVLVLLISKISTKAESRYSFYRSFSPEIELD